MKTISVKEAAQELGGVHANTIYSLISKRKFEVIRLTPQGAYRIIRESFERFKKKSTTPAALH